LKALDQIFGWGFFYNGTSFFSTHAIGWYVWYDSYVAAG
jgi:hypothetical protein